MNSYKMNVLLLSSVLQYLEKPYGFIDYLVSKNIEFIVIDRAPLMIEGNDRITIQTVPKNIYDAKYPCWILNEKNVLNRLLKHYDLIFEDQSAETINISNAAFKSFFFKRVRD